ncbi:M10 family metallopeptidase C-terminal domain-containing protein [Novosphingobium nitrogenifigens]
MYGANTTYHTGDDTYTYSPNQPFYATIWDAGGNDTINLSAFSNPCVVDLHPGSYSLLGFNGVTLDPNLGIAFGCTIENAIGGQGADAIDGNDVANVLKGGGGADTLTGEAGRDTLYGGAGMDHLYGGAGNDILSGGDGNDQLFGGSGADQLMGGYGADILHGGTGDDYLYGQAGNDTLYADSGADKLFGGDGNDVLYAGTGNSKLYGGNGNDILHGGAGHALLTGGAGADTFLFDKGETGGLTPTSCVEITDFNPAQGDIISLAPMTAYDPYAGASVPTQIGTALTLTFIGSAAFSHTTGEVRYEVDSGYTLIEGDTNGDGQADFMIRLDGVTTFAASELVL